MSDRVALTPDAAYDLVCARTAGDGCLYEVAGYEPELVAAALYSSHPSIICGNLACSNAIGSGAQTNSLPCARVAKVFRRRLESEHDTHDAVMIDTLSRTNNVTELQLPR